MAPTSCRDQGRVIRAHSFSSGLGNHLSKFPSALFHFTLETRFPMKGTFRISIWPQITSRSSRLEKSRRVYLSEKYRRQLEEISATEVTGIHRGSSFFVDANRHLYRPHRKKSENVRYVYCYFSRPVGRGIFREHVKCPAFGSIDLETNIIKLTTKHNHEPNSGYVAQLEARNCILKRVREEPHKTLKQIFEEENGSEHGLIYKSLLRTMRRVRPCNLIGKNNLQSTSCQHCGSRVFHKLLMKYNIGH